MLGTVLDVVAAVCMVLGALMSFGAALGLLRFPDLLTRMHAGAKPQVFGLLLMLTALAIEGGNPAMVGLISLGWLFQLLTVPVSTHMVGRASYRTKHLNPETLVQDDLRELLDRVSAADQEETAGSEPSAPDAVRRQPGAQGGEGLG